jgi:thymidylate kinase
MAPEIVATLTGNRPVVADRYLASAIAYGMTDGLSYDWLLAAQAFLPQPDLNILLDVPVEASFERRPERRDQYELNKSYLQEVANNYRKLWLDRGWLTVDGTGAVEEVHDKILAAVLKWRANA